MSLRKRFPAAFWISRTLTGRVARRVYAGVVAVLIATGAGIRVYTYTLTRRMQAVIAGLSKLEIDKSSEGNVARVVPYVVRRDWHGKLTRTPETGEIDLGIEHLYTAQVSNERFWLNYCRYVYAVKWCSPNAEVTEDGYVNGCVYPLANLLGYRYVAFGASVTLLDGKVSTISYGVANRLTGPRVFGEIVSVKSVHSFWTAYRREFEIRSTDDESPQFRVNGNEDGLGVAYTYDAPRELTEHAFEVHLSCFWGLQGCRHVKQIAPQLWQDRNAIESATLARLQSAEPCPDRILAGRIRYLPDTAVLVLEAKGFSTESVTQGNHRLEGVVTKYEAVEAIAGGLPKGIQSIWAEDTVPFPGDYRRRLPNGGVRSANAGERVLEFSNMRFDSCGIVAATPSALAAVRSVSRAPRRSEDQLVFGLM